MHWLTPWDLNANTLQKNLVYKGQVDQILLIKTTYSETCLHWTPLCIDHIVQCRQVFNLTWTLKKSYFIAYFGRAHEVSQSLISPFVALQIACEFAHSHAIGQVLQCTNLLSQGFLNVFPFPVIIKSTHNEILRWVLKTMFKVSIYRRCICVPKLSVRPQTVQSKEEFTQRRCSI